MEPWVTQLQLGKEKGLTKKGFMGKGHFPIYISKFPYNVGKVFYFLVTLNI